MGKIIKERINLLIEMLVTRICRNKLNNAKKELTEKFESIINNLTEKLTKEITLQLGKENRELLRTIKKEQKRNENLLEIAKREVRKGLRRSFKIEDEKYQRSRIKNEADDYAVSDHAKSLEIDHEECPLHPTFSYLCGVTAMKENRNAEQRGPLHDKTPTPSWHVSR